jgi:hypothetical protein
VEEIRLVKEEYSCEAFERPDKLLLKPKDYKKVSIMLTNTRLLINF